MRKDWTRAFWRFRFLAEMGHNTDKEDGQMTGVSAGAKKSLRNPVGLRQLQNKSRHRPSSPPTLKSSAHNSPHCALSGYFQIPMAATSAWLRGLVQHVPSTRRRTGLSFSSLLPGSSLSLITPTLWGYKAIRLGAQRPLASTAAIQGGTQ